MKRLQRIDKQMSARSREMFAAYIPNGDMASYAKRLTAALHKDFTGTMALLRDSAFQDLLMHYERAARTFLIAYESEDAVTSEWLVRDADGREYKPEDYLAAFGRFVRDNSAHIQAIRILLDRPREWSIQALSELMQKLAATPERFDVRNLQKAHEMRYHKALVDIISNDQARRQAGGAALHGRRAGCSRLRERDGGQEVHAGTRAVAPTY